MFVFESIYQAWKWRLEIDLLHYYYNDVVYLCMCRHYNDDWELARIWVRVENILISWVYLLYGGYIFNGWIWRYPCGDWFWKDVYNRSNHFYHYYDSEINKWIAQIDEHLKPVSMSCVLWKIWNPPHSDHWSCHSRCFEKFYKRIVPWGSWVGR